MRTNFISITLYLLCTSLLTEAFNWPHWGRCPYKNVKQDFDLENYMYRWFQQAGYNTEFGYHNLRCISAVYNLTDGVVNVHNQALTQDNKWVEMDGTAVETDPDKQEGKLTVTFRLSSWYTVSGPYWVLNTDYNSYSVVYSCENFLFFFHYYYVWFLSRQQVFHKREEEKYFSRVIKVLKSHKIDPSVMKRTSQENCATI